MWNFGTLLSAGALLVSTGSTIAGIYQSNKAAKASTKASEARERANRLLQKKNDLQVRRQAVTMVREGRIKRAKAISASQAQGAGLRGSGIQGGAGSFITQTASGFGFLRDTQNLAFGARSEMAQSTIFGNEGVRLQNSANIFNSVASLSGSIFDNRVGITNLAKQFGVA